MRLHIRTLLALLLFSSLGLTACQGDGPVSPLLVAETVLLNSGAPATAAPSAAAPVTATAAPVTAPETGVVAAATTADYPETMPVALAIPAVGLQAQVTPMGWEPVMLGETVATRWVVPEGTLGWAVNSAGAGDAGNVVIAGHQAAGAALLRPLALGEVIPGQEILLQAANGVTYLYRVTEVSAPITAIGASDEEQAQAAAFLAPADSPRLTLITGWPADITTHRVFVVAEYAGVQP